MERILKFIMCLMLVLFFAAVAGGFYLVTHITSEDIEVTNYTVEATVDNTIRIVQLTDLHNKEFGENNMILVATVEAQNPDLILMTGDMINKDDENLDVVTDLIRQLSEIAPVYYGYGNHETSWEVTYGAKLHDVLTEAGAVVLECEYQDVTVNDNQIRIGGYMAYYGCPHLTSSDETKIKTDEQFFTEFQNTDSYKLLLNHIPTQWVDWNYIDKESWNLDLVFSGHYHGGQWVLPIVGPVYASYVGKFPEHVKGCYKGAVSTCILSAGLGNEYQYLPRVNNPPELVVVELEPNP